MKKEFDLVDPKTLEIVKTITKKELLKLLGVKFLNQQVMIDGLLITERD